MSSGLSARSRGALTAFDDSIIGAVGNFQVDVESAREGLSEGML